MPFQCRMMAHHLQTLVLLPGLVRTTLNFFHRCSWATGHEWDIGHLGTLLGVCSTSNKSFQYTASSYAWVPEMLFFALHRRTLFPLATTPFIGGRWRNQILRDRQWRPEAGRWGKWRMLVPCYRVSVCENETVLEIDGGWWGLHDTVNVLPATALHTEN